MLGKVPKACPNATLVQTTARHAEADGLGTSTCITTSKGHITHALTRCARNQARVFWAFLLKRPSRKGEPRCSLPLYPSSVVRKASSSPCIHAEVSRGRRLIINPSSRENTSPYICIYQATEYLLVCKDQPKSTRLYISMSREIYYGKENT